ncbi:MAG: alpha/beta hydrolase [Actinomycetaceae bacterium]|nr:alpha/beta hydrolase [Actinomycetaceae bacterium]
MRLRVLAVAAATTIVIAACQPFSSTPQPAPPSATVAPQAQLQKFYDQSLDWQPCREDPQVLKHTEGQLRDKSYRCARMQVPLDYANPEGETITLQLARYSTSGGAKTPLLFNPGGPGGGAVSSLKYMARDVFSPEVTGEYDLVAVDPRGVGLSSPVQCFSAAQTDRERSQTMSTSVAEVLADGARLGQQCVEEAGELVKFADTDSVVKDFDVVRAVLGQEKLNYVGFSYGTFIGALYADEFPSQVGRFVLDGAMDPSSSIGDIARGQAGGFEASVTHWLQTAAAQESSDWPLASDPEAAKRELRQWLDGLEEHPLPTAYPKRPLTRSLAFSALLASMYSQATYDYASAGLRQAMNDEDGSFLLQIADTYARRAPDGTYRDNSYDAFLVVNALDYEASGSEDEWEQQARQLSADFPTVGSEFAFSEAGIQSWPVESKKVRRNVTGAGAAPILVVGTRHDPATPYVWAQALAQQLESATLLTWEGWDHCAYSSAESGSCVREAIDDYLLDGDLPEDGFVCQ